MLKDLFDAAHRDDGQRVFDFVRDVAQVFAVFFRDKHGFDVAAHGGKQFFFEAANRQHPSVQSDFAGHGQITPYRDFAEGG